MMEKHCFTYGTLMCPDIMEEVTGRGHRCESGVLQGFLRSALKGEVYPGIIPREDCDVRGIVYWDVSPEAWRRLDKFEGDLYERRRVQIELSDGSCLSAGAYVVKPEFTSRLSLEDWRPDRFLKYGKSQFRRFYKGYGAIE